MNNEIDVIMPLNDDSAEFLSKHKLALSAYTKLLMPDYNKFMAAYDKNLLMKLCERNGYPHPYTVTLYDNPNLGGIQLITLDFQVLSD